MIPRMGTKGRNRCHASRNRKARFAAGLFTHSIMIGGVRRFALDQLQDAAKNREKHRSLRVHQSHPTSAKTPKSRAP
jgi:hypothetical protein